MSQKKYLVIHGHFYQPPRENPWLGFIETQDSASPFPNWNERITAECYKANTLSRRLDPTGRILDIVNNFNYLSFNIGPTLINWLRANHPKTYKGIIAADRESMGLNHGHGNAIGQVYNHLIMPLATRREQELQIALGKKDFNRHFGREPESLWLAETAINGTTVELLIKHGIRYVILSPSQAQRIRPIGKDQWTDSSNGSVDTTRAYRIFSENGHIDAFFFNKEVSTAVAFLHLLRDARRFGDELLKAMGDPDSPTLLNICTDGESYGHHEPFGDMCLAAFFSGHAQERGFRVTNYGHFLDRFPPEMEVELIPGKEGQGTSWSCAHGVDRWQADCGCSTGGRPDWNQQWRGPLRRGLRKVKEELDKTYTERAGLHLIDPWAALEEFIELRDRRVSPEDAAPFFEKHGKGELTPETKQPLFRLMESEFYGNLMFTSCGWFFDDISGLEPVQNLRYAARAIELFERAELERLLLDELAQCKSNVDQKTGKEIYQEQAASLLKTYDLIANQAVMESALLEKEEESVFLYHLSFSNRERFDNYGLIIGDLELEDRFLGIKKRYFFFCAQTEDSFLQSWLGEDTQSDLRSEIAQKLAKWARGDSMVSAPEIGSEYRFKRYGLSDLLEFNREEILDKAMDRGLKPLKEEALSIFTKNNDLIRQMVRFGIDLPPEARMAVSYGVHHELKKEVEYVKRESDPEKYRKMIELMNFARKLKIPLKTDIEKGLLMEALLEKMANLFKDPDQARLDEVRNVTRLIASLDLAIDLAPAQNEFFIYLNGSFQALTGKPRETLQENAGLAVDILNLAEGSFEINVDRFRERLRNSGGSLEG